ncbi:reticulon protein [Gregarina niphandrodes]|uniref:Reticulon protein n=1 Tax=Gregarina niphandrodes TaxID=110365 RepID=A0A023B8Q0_GRENI|nr:reticulon protein [Gregarina niphandrodes]EZG70153.1 reticulon protein [Gregarina niphandrodes]|eukprot:XP_011129972.1 reticulon protein [Gregarina niphandrodes]
MSSQTSTASSTPSSVSFGSVFGSVEKIASWQDIGYSTRYVLGLNVGCLIAFMVRLKPLSTFLFLCGFASIAGFALTRVLGWKEDVNGAAILISEAQSQKISESLQQSMNYVYKAARHVFYWADKRYSATVTAVCFVTSYLMTIFSLPVVTLLLADGYLLQKPAIELYQKHGKAILQPYLDQGLDKVQSMHKKMPSVQDIITLLASSGKNKKI